jgi:hypothetical protein
MGGILSRSPASDERQRPGWRRIVVLDDLRGPREDSHEPKRHDQMRRVLRVAGEVRGGELRIGEEGHAKDGPEVQPVLGGRTIGHDEFVHAARIGHPALDHGDLVRGRVLTIGAALEGGRRLARDTRRPRVPQDRTWRVPSKPMTSTALATSGTWVLRHRGPGPPPRPPSPSIPGAISARTR